MQVQVYTCHLDHILDENHLNINICSPVLDTTDVKRGFVGEHQTVGSQPLEGKTVGHQVTIQT